MHTPPISTPDLTRPDPSDPPYLQGLNGPQRQAVLTTEGPVLMLAGAGTGKTAALTARLAHIIATRRAWPSEILAVTFTNKAAREMRERIGRMIGDAVEGMPWLGTFHSICAKMLRRHAELVGLQKEIEAATGGTVGLKKALQMEPSAIVEEVVNSGLRGRGDAECAARQAPSGRHR